MIILSLSLSLSLSRSLPRSASPGHTDACFTASTVSSPHGLDLRPRIHHEELDSNPSSLQVLPRLSEPPQEVDEGDDEGPLRRCRLASRASRGVIAAPNSASSSPL